LADFEALLRTEGASQNLISRASFDHLNLRHIADSAQLLAHAPSTPGEWLDLGSGAGFPGLIVALLSSHRVTLVESRRLRIEILGRAAAVLGVSERTTILGAPLERVPPRPFDVISARAFAPLPKLLALAHPFSTEKTRWILPKGRSAQTELAAAQSSWQGDFRLEPSLTDAGAGIIIAERVRPRSQRKAS
jgi:16S rRNA (guanine527-N7)-methyltransferase